MEDVAFIVFGFALILIFVGLCQCYCFLLKLRNVLADNHAMRRNDLDVVLRNCGYTCDPLRDRSNRLGESCDSSPPYYGSGVFPDAFAISGSHPGIDIPPPTYEEAIQSTLTHNRTRQPPSSSDATLHI